MLTKCYLQCLLNQAKKIYIPESETVFLGRNPFTDIQDLNLSRKHLECKVNFNPNELTIKSIGKNYSGCNGYALLMNETYHLKHNDILELRLGYHRFKIVFEDENESVVEPASKKAKYTIFDMELGKLKNSLVANFNGKWETIADSELLIFTPENCTSQRKIASFDMDGTLIKTKSGATFPKDKDDWEVNFNTVSSNLRKLYQDNYKLVIFTNQSGVGKNSDKIKEFKEKIEKIIKTLSVPIQVFISLGKGIYRKPLTGMWNVLSEIKNDNLEINMDESFFVGDAAGRVKDWAPKKIKDHSSADRLFALNVGLKFQTPEEYFRKTSKNPFKMPLFDPRNLKVENYPNFMTHTQDIILMVGSQGSGKSHFCKTQLIPKGYVYINRDTLKSWEKCVLMLEDCINKKKNAVIDNTNPDKTAREKYISIAKKFNVQCRCFIMATSLEHCKHNNKFRNLTDKTHAVISDMLLYSYRKKYEPPEISEGFSEIINVPFVTHFESQEEEKLYKMFLLES